MRVKEATHTQGPWSIDTGIDKRSWGYIRPTDGEVMQGALKCPSVARVFDSQCGRKEAEANARLIAAAPELLEACIFALDRLDTLIDAEEATDYDVEVRNKLVRTIARAEGSEE